MPWMSFDLEDGHAPVGFSLKREDADRFMAFMRECQSAASDGRRLEWVLRNVSGAELRRMGIMTSAGATRADIDAMLTGNNDGGIEGDRLA